MRQSAVAALAPLPFELVIDDGEPLESDWHAMQYPLLRTLIYQAMVEQGRTDFFVAGNMFVYYSLEQARQVAEEEAKGLEKKTYRGPDVFWVGGVPFHERQCWIAWEEGGRLPDVVIELLSPSTEEKDRKEKREIYSRIWRTAEYFLHEPDKIKLEGLRLAGGDYRPIRPEANGRIWSEKLGVYLGVWRGEIEGRNYDWVRLFRRDGTLIPTPAERADAAEAEVTRLRALLAARGQA
jgi:Uma2 family endonuclease